MSAHGRIVKAEWDKEEHARNHLRSMGPVRLSLTKLRVHLEEEHGATMIDDYELDAAGWHSKHYPGCTPPKRMISKTGELIITHL